MPRSISCSLYCWLLGIGTAMVSVVPDSATITLGAEEAVTVPRWSCPGRSVYHGSSAKALDEDAAEKPVQEVVLPAFYIDKYEVTNAQYARFLNAVKQARDDAGHEYLGADRYLQLDRPAASGGPRKDGQYRWERTWYGATAYARWQQATPYRSRMGKAARGADAGSTLERYMDFAKFRLGIDHLSPVAAFPPEPLPTAV